MVRNPAGQNNTSEKESSAELFFSIYIDVVYTHADSPPCLRLFGSNPAGQFSICSLRALEGLGWWQQDIGLAGSFLRIVALGRGGEL